MRPPLQRALELTLLLGFSATAVLAKDDPKYNPSQNFRPDNVTGLSAIYAWVGSYYNATTTIELSPIMGATVNVSLCERLQGQTIHQEFDSVLSITERGLYNEGDNPFNLWLTTFPQDFNMSSLPAAQAWDADLMEYNNDITTLLRSSSPTWKRDENSTVADNFKFNSPPRNQSDYRINGTVGHTGEDFSTATVNITMPACNSSEQVDEWSWSAYTFPWWSTEGWDDFEIPQLDAQFDDKTAKLTMHGDFSAYVYIRRNSTFLSPPTLGQLVQGTFKMTVSGVLDEYHSDTLVMNSDSASPTWLRTVGFGNDSKDIGYDSAASQQTSSRSGIVALGLAMMWALL